MKKLLCIVLAIVMMFSFTACGKETPKKAADNALKAVKSLNISKMEKYFGEVEVENLNLGDISADEIRVVKKYLSKMSWEIVEVEEKGEEAVVKVSLTTVDLAPIAKKVAGELLGDALSSLFGNSSSKEEMTKKACDMILDMLSEKDVKMSVDEIELNMYLTDSGWKVELKKSLFGSVLGDWGIF